MFDIITFGSACWDVFLELKEVLVEKNRKFITGKGFCFNLGSKIDLEDICLFSGGGGTNTAATFAKQGFKVAYCGAVGDDVLGKEAIEELKKAGLDTRFVLRKKMKPTNFSVVLSLQEKDRIILVYRGASEIFEEKDIPWNKLRARWFYLAPLSGNLCQRSEKVVDFAFKNKIKVAINPGNSQLNLPPKILARILKKIDILILNQEEASLLTKIPYQKEKEIFQKIDEMCPGIAIMTKGAKGMVVSDGKEIYQAGAPKIKVVDRTGGGDAAGSGFVTGLIKSNGNIEYAIQLGMANATSCLRKWGAKNGLLKKDEKFKEVRVTKKKL